jgi:protein-tyrosine phosphatase
MTRTALIVCTANICRSPMAAALLRRALQSDGSSTVVASAGTHAHESTVAEHAVTVMGERGIDISNQPARLLSRGDLDGADVVLAMERAHVAHVVAMAPEAFPKTFCLRELAELARARGPRRPDETFEEWLARLHRGRRAADVLRSGTEFDVADPYGGSVSEFEQCARELDEVAREVGPLLA